MSTGLKSMGWSRPEPTLPNPSVPLNGPLPWWLLAFYVAVMAVVVAFPVLLICLAVHG